MHLHTQNALPLIFPSKEMSDGALAIDNKFDVEFADQIAKLESYNKHLYRPNTYLHKWWARRCGSTFRLILKHLVPDSARRDYYLPGGLEGKIILDPMAGGGTTLHEAIRLGASVIGADIDPIPVLQARATMSSIPLKSIENAFDSFYNSLCERLSGMFLAKCPKCSDVSEIQFTLYGAKRSCSCKSAIFVDSTILRYEQDGSTIEICPFCHEISKNRLCNCRHDDSKTIILEKGIKSCPDCNKTFKEDKSIPFFTRYAPLAIIGKCPDHGLFFKKPSENELEKIRIADMKRPDLNFGSDNDILKIKSGPKSGDLIKRGINSYSDLFSSRQLLYLHHSIELLQDIDPLIRLNLALLVSTSLEFNSMLCGYKGGSKKRPGAVRHTFSHHAYSFPYTALENNMLYPKKSSGTLNNLFNSRIRRGRLWAVQPKERVLGSSKQRTVTINGETDSGTEVYRFDELKKSTQNFFLIQGSSVSIGIGSDCVDYVVTDPPYFDSVQYSDLAAFFRVWLHKLLPDFADWTYDVAGSAVENGNGKEGNYATLLTGILKECHRVLKKDTGRLIFTFHHWNPKGWAALAISLKRAGFYLVNRYVVHSENPVSVHIAKLKSLKHDAILVMAPIEITSAPLWQLPLDIDKTDSKKFSEDCAAVLGWMLKSSLSEDAIKDKWYELLK
ncbi:DNA methyltransferase [Desulfobacterales bacterium HSG16]|nr:DNA methyltransferase [Desulfobacterales bacterium HSG16]